MNQNLYSQQIRHISPSRASYGGVYCGEFGENWPRHNGTALLIKNQTPHDWIYSMVYVSFIGWSRRIDRTGIEIENGERITQNAGKTVIATSEF